MPGLIGWGRFLEHDQRDDVVRFGGPSWERRHPAGKDHEMVPLLTPHAQLTAFAYCRRNRCWVASCESSDRRLSAG